MAPRETVRRRLTKKDGGNWFQSSESPEYARLAALHNRDRPDREPGLGFASCDILSIFPRVFLVSMPITNQPTSYCIVVPFAPDHRCSVLWPHLVSAATEVQVTRC